MAVNRVDFGGNTLIDLTGDTLELPEQLLKGIIAHCKDGTPIEGTLEAGVGDRKILEGSFVPSSDVTKFTVKHDFGTIPSFACWFLSDMNSAGFEKKDALIGVACRDITSQIMVCSNITSSYNFVSSFIGKFHTNSEMTYKIAGNGYAWAVANETNITANCNSIGYFRAGKIYNYILIGD